MHDREPLASRPRPVLSRHLARAASEFDASGSAIVASPFRDKDQRVVGALGVIGPTRLNYARVVPMVDYTAKLVGRLMR